MIKKLINMKKKSKNDYELLKFARDKLFFFKEENINAILKLLTLTDFKEDLLINLNYLRGIEQKTELNDTEKSTIIKLNNKKLKNKEYFRKLLKTDFINQKELFYLITMHEQRHYFNLSDDMKKTLQARIDKMPSLPNEPDLSDIDSIAVFGATYNVQKDRLINGLEYYRNKKGIDPTKIYLLTGYRRMYISEFNGLGIISKQDLEDIKELYEKECGKKLDNLNPDELIDFIKKKEELLSKFDDKKIKETLQHLNMYDKNKTKIELLEQISQLTEEDFFHLAVTELKEQNFLNDKQNIHFVVSNEMNGANIFNIAPNQKSNVKRANTEDTLRALWEIDSNFNKMLFISNGPYTLQQFTSTLSVQDTQNIKVPKIYGKDATHGTPANIAARHYGMISMVEKLFRQREDKIQNLLSSKNVNQLKPHSSNSDEEIENEKMAYESGKDVVNKQNNTYLGR